MKFRFNTKLLRTEKFAVIKVPKEISENIENSNEITVTIEYGTGKDKTFDSNNNIEDIKIQKKIDLEKKVYNWFVTRSSLNDDGKMSASPRTVANNFGITITEAQVILAVLEAEGMIKEDRNVNGLYVMTGKKKEQI